MNPNTLLLLIGYALALMAGVGHFFFDMSETSFWGALILGYLYITDGGDKP